MKMDLFEYDKNEGVFPLCGVDEAGRGPLAGDVYAAAVIFPPDVAIEGLDDSKKLTPKKRDALYDEIREKAAAYCVATASVAEIEEMNILNAAMLAMKRAVEGLSVSPRLVLVDGNRNPRWEYHSRCVVKGDATSASIAAASILAKVERDRYMKRLDREYPQYQYAKHKGYGTPLHYQMLDQFGPSPLHRMSFLKNYVPGTESPAAQKGRMGEEAVCAYLEREGYQIAERNYHSAFGEIDLIARREKILAFVEVKARTEGGTSAPRAAVGASKQKKILKTALTYLAEKKCGLQPRFDVAEVFFEKKGKHSGPQVAGVNYMENAFDGGDCDAYL